MNYRIDYLDKLKQAGADPARFTAVTRAMATLPLAELKAVVHAYTGAARDYRSRQEALKAVLAYGCRS
jgi:hypothetical protein